MALVLHFSFFFIGKKNFFTFPFVSEAQQQQERKRREGAAVKIQKKVRGMEARQRAQSLMGKYMYTPAN